MSDSPAEWPNIAVEGKTIVTAKYGKTDLGYDCISILFSDGVVLRIEEQGQTGWFSVDIIES